MDDDNNNKFIDLLEYSLMQMGYIFTFTNSSYTFHSNEYSIIFTPSCISFLNGIYISSSQDIDLIISLLENHFKNFSFQNNFCIHLFFKIPSLYNESLIKEQLKLLSKKYVNNIEEETTILMITSTYNPIDIPLDLPFTLHKVINENDNRNYLSVVSSAFNFPNNDKLLSICKQCFKIPYNNDYIMKECNYTEYYGTIYDNDKQEYIPCCSGRILRLSANLMNYFSELQFTNDPSIQFYCIFGLATIKKYRKQGFGSLMVKILMQKAKEMGATHIGLHAEKTATDFYSKLGFKTIGTQWSLECNLK